MYNETPGEFIRNIRYNIRYIYYTYRFVDIIE